MNKQIQEIAEQAGAKFPFGGFVNYDQFDCEKFAELIVQDCADQIRSNYDHEHAESVAWNLEIEYGLHGDHAE